MSTHKGIEVARCLIVGTDDELLSMPNLTVFRRALDSKNNPGRWEFPGGKVDEQDRQGAANHSETLLRAGIRETYEETGLIVEPLGEPVLVQSRPIVGGVHDGEPYTAHVFPAVITGGELDISTSREVVAHTQQTPESLRQSPALTFVARLSLDAYF